MIALTSGPESPICVQAWSRLLFTEAGRVRLAEMASFVDELRVRSAPHVERQFRDRMGYLNDYGGSMSDGDHRRRFRITLARDWAPLSFVITWAALDTATGTHRFAFDGALIWHGGPTNPLCVSLTPQLWGIHT